MTPENVTVSEPIDVPLSVDLLKARAVYAVYRLWDKAGTCLYVGKSVRSHPLLRIAQHSTKSWWNEVASADYVTVEKFSDLNRAEAEQIYTLNPRHNIYGKPGSERTVRNTKTCRDKLSGKTPDTPHDLLDLTANASHHLQVVRTQLQNSSGLLSADHAAELLGVSAANFRRYWILTRLPYYAWGRFWQVRGTDLLDHLQSQISA